MDIGRFVARATRELVSFYQREWTFNAVPTLFLYNTQLPIPRCRRTQAEIPKPSRDAAYWANKTGQFDFTKEDDLGNPETFNRIIWEGLKGKVPYPSERNGADLRKDRRQILRGARVAVARPDFSLATTGRPSGAIASKDISDRP